MKWLMRKILKQVVKLYFFVDKECYCFHIGTKHPNYDYTVTKEYISRLNQKWRKLDER